MWKRKNNSIHSLSQQYFERGDEHQISIILSMWKNSVGDTEQSLLLSGNENCFLDFPTRCSPVITGLLTELFWLTSSKSE